MSINLYVRRTVREKRLAKYSLQRINIHWNSKIEIEMLSNLTSLCSGEQVSNVSQTAVKIISRKEINKTWKTPLVPGLECWVYPGRGYSSSWWYYSSLLWREKCFLDWDYLPWQPGTRFQVQTGLGVYDFLKNHSHHTEVGGGGNSSKYTLSVFYLFVPNKHQNGWTDRAQDLCGTSYDLRGSLWMIKISIASQQNSIFIKF